MVISIDNIYFSDDKNWVMFWKYLYKILQLWIVTFPKTVITLGMDICIINKSSFFYKSKLIFDYYNLNSSKLNFV